jgi:CubicO group peptidase (beta-lactamase class C family)
MIPVSLPARNSSPKRKRGCLQGRLLSKLWNVRRALLCVASFWFLVSCNRTASPEPWLDAGTAKHIDEVFAAYNRSGSPGFAIGLIRDGTLVFDRGYGDANLDDRIPITSQTSFHLASLSKQFTAAAVALLMLDGKLSMEDRVARFIPETAKYGSDLRVEDLIYMTSGLHEYFDVPRQNGVPWFSAYYFTRDEAIRSALAPDRLLFKPGTRYDYSNTNFMLLTKIVEKVSGKPFSAFMRDRIFAPLGMNDTRINDDSTALIPNRALGYAPRDARTIAQLRSVGVFARPGPGWILLARNSPHFGGSGVFSTLADLAKWDANWDSGRLAGPALTKMMTRRLRFDFGTMDGMGLGFHSRYGQPTVNYSGADIDASSFMERFPKERFTIVCLSNDPLGDAEGKAAAVLAILHQSGRI